MDTPEKVSLADLSRLGAEIIKRGSSDDLSLVSQPSLSELTESLFFAPGDGRIWLNDQRMFLMHATSLGHLRRELIESLGVEKARGLLTRIGYASGSRDAQLVGKYWPTSEPAQAFAAGPRLHSIEGVVQVEPVRFEFDASKGQFYGEFIWHNSVEYEQHIEQYGISHEPTCWMQLGYASGYASTFLGRLIVYREVECSSMGHERCRIIGKPADEWDDPTDAIRSLSAESFSNQFPQADEPDTAGGRARLMGVSPAFNSASHMIRRVADTNATVLFTGESGVGKEMFAWYLHNISPRAECPFVAVNCAAIPETLIESELFGVERGAFTGATTARSGRFERAEGGTLFLDEIGTLSLVAQGKLLRALQEHEIERIGGTKTTKVDVRVVAATNVNLREAVAKGTFREDLFYRLNVFPVHLPPLRERKEDIPLLTDYFIRRYSKRHGRKVLGVSHRAVTALLNYEFPGNVRELENLVERAIILVPNEGVLDVFHLFSGEEQPKAVGYAISSGGALQTKDELNRDKQPNAGKTSPHHRPETGGADGATRQSRDRSREEYVQAVQQHRGNLSAASRALGITRAQLAYRLQAFGIHVSKRTEATSSANEALARPLA